MTFLDIESTSVVWRHVINYNFDNLKSTSFSDNLAALYSDTSHTHTEYKTRTTAESEAATALGLPFGYDITYADKTNGVVIYDRTLLAYYRLYISSGSLLVEAV